MYVRLILFLVLFPLTAFAEALPRPQSDTVSDFAGILSASERQTIATMLRATREKTGVHVVVVTMDRIANHGGRGLGVPGYATQLFNAWGIGDAQKNDGILMLVVTEARETRIELGQGFSASYDKAAAEVIQTAMLPMFRQQRFGQGIIAGLKALEDKVVRPFANRLWRMILIGVGIVGGGVGLVFAGKAAWSAYVRCPQCGQPSLSRWNEVIQHATTYSSGHGITHLSCPLCGYQEDRPYTIAQDNDDSSSGSSGGGSSSGGFGGGRSSGGGASGKW